MQPERLLETVQAIIEEAKICFFITVGQAGQPNARLMQPFGPQPDLTFWCGASPSSRKVQDIQRDSRIVLAYEAAEKGAYVSLLGVGTLETGLEERRQYWRDSFSVFWPDGPESDDYLLIKFTPSRIEVMHIAQKIAPEPFGLKPAVLQRTKEGWQLVDED